MFVEQVLETLGNHQVPTILVMIWISILDKYRVLSKLLLILMINLPCMIVPLCLENKIAIDMGHKCWTAFPNVQCQNCKAWMWSKESVKLEVSVLCLVFTLCCKQDLIRLPAFRVNKQTYHKIGSLIPEEGHRPRVIVEGLMIMLDQINEVAEVIRTARDRFEQNQGVDFSLKLFVYRDSFERNYAAPVSTDIAKLIIGDETQEIMEKNIIIEHKSGDLKKISNLHPLFISMQYPLLFPYGEDGFHLGIRYAESPLKKQMQRKTVTMRELIRIKFSRGNLREDVIATFTCNDNWAEIKEALKFIPGQRPEDRPDIVARVFKLKLQELMTVLTDNEHFGPSEAVAYSVEFQKRGLPHVHILMWLLKDPAELGAVIEVGRGTAVEAPTDANVVHDEIKAYLDCSQPLENVMAMENITKTMFIEWFEANRKYESAKSYLYVDFPTGWVWKTKDREWVQRQIGDTIGRIIFVHPAADDRKWQYTMILASEWATTYKLRVVLFVSMMMYSEVGNPTALFENNWHIMADDIFRYHATVGLPNCTMLDEELRNYAVSDVQGKLKLKVGCMVMLMRNVNQAAGMCNVKESKWPFVFNKKQFPLRL
ncbi:hypothetical protein COLO4_38264 [Corchorus olitorius]|uniref:Uncharacterized protein n=1 Tax=Corchorus olitorius TaxID=93759 RepID=A0A1R3FVU4_9ROSI|nr:hypothetical protein COLO4_38264 [Corchorus olitorius]